MRRWVHPKIPVIPNDIFVGLGMSTLTFICGQVRSQWMGSKLWSYFLVNACLLFLGGEGGTPFLSVWM